MGCCHVGGQIVTTDIARGDGGNKELWIHSDALLYSCLENFYRYRKKTATAVAFAKQGRGLIKVNGQPIENIEPEILRLKVFEPVLIVGQDKFSNLDIRIRVKGGGMTAQIYAIRAAIAKSIVAYHAKYVDESSKNEIRKTLLEYDRNLLVSDPRRCEPKKYGGRSARARFQKSYR